MPPTGVKQDAENDFSPRSRRLVLTCVLQSPEGLGNSCSSQEVQSSQTKARLDCTLFDSLLGQAAAQGKARQRHEQAEAGQNDKANRRALAAGHRQPTGRAGSKR